MGAAGRPSSSSSSRTQWAASRTAAKSARSRTSCATTPPPSSHLADQACVTLHRWLSRTDRAGGPDHPDRLVFDLDPAGDE
ncbi:hypothetical protein [Streptomyces sp. NPDC088760]|uniref:non-homologous end-joining DNA ligase LigD n=1 Tax=Streptomyces sp. NPDC088760 TaxID=3365890 RepID=UPI003821E738